MNYKLELGNYVIKFNQNDFLLIKSVLAIIIVLLIISAIFILFTNDESRKNIKKYISIGFWANIGILFCNIFLGIVIGSILALLIFV